MPHAELIRFEDPKPVEGADNPELLTDGTLDALNLCADHQFELEELYTTWDQLDAAIDRLTAEREQKRQALGRLLDSIGIKAVGCAELKVAWVHSHNSTINKMALLANGVSSSVIEASTKRTPFRQLSVVNVARAAADKAAKATAKNTEVANA